MKRGTIVRRPNSVVCGEVVGNVRPSRAPNTLGAVWVFWDTGTILAEDPTTLEVVLTHLTSSEERNAGTPASWVSP